MTARAAPRPDTASAVLLAALSGSGLAVVGSATGSIIASVPMYRIEFIDHCASIYEWLVGHPEALLTAVPIGLVFAFTTRALRAIGEQIRHTRRLRRDLGQIVPLPPRFSALMQRLGIAARLDVVEAAVSAVFCHRVWQPRICVTTAVLTLLDADELAAVLLHERHHLRRRDPARLALARTVLAGTGFLPGAGAIYERYFEASELAADAAALQLPGGRLALANAMLKLARSQAKLLVDASVVCSASTVPSRVAALLAAAPPASPMPWAALVQASATLMVLVALMSAPLALATRPEAGARHPCAALGAPPASAPVIGPGTVESGT